MHVVLTIAGSDSGAGAGIQADLKTFAAHQVYGVCAITAVTAQNTRGVMRVDALPSEVVTAQIEAVASDFTIAAAKTGALATAAIVEAVTAAVEELDIPFLVVDPVLLSTSGHRLLDDEGLAAMRAALIREAFVVTPNIPEAEALTGVTIRDQDGAIEAARRIVGMGARAVIVKGGHAPGDIITDLLFDGDEIMLFTTERVGSDPHGTGCAFSASLTTQLALGYSLQQAIPLVQTYVAGAIRHGIALGHGRGLMDHFWALRAGGAQGAVRLY
jgi:hydroxymethylpyrimidine/phosphomethylpyrimidine kinase